MKFYRSIDKNLREVEHQNGVIKKVTFGQNYFWLILELKAPQSI